MNIKINIDFPILQESIQEKVNEIRKRKQILLSDEECIFLYVYSLINSKLEGEFAEAGAFEGGSSEIIHLAAPKKVLYVFESFIGLDNIGPNDSGFSKGEHKALKEKCIFNTPKIILIEGDFKETSRNFLDKRFAFVHLDLDLFDITSFSIDFFYPRLVDGGIILLHDFGAEGIKAAIALNYYKYKYKVINFGNYGIIIK